MSSADLVRAQYAGFDFNTHLDDLRARIQVQYATTYNDFAVSALGMMLLDSVAFGLDTLSFYLDRRATDTYLDTARTRKSVSRLTRQLGYKMRAAVASSVDLTVTIPNPGFDATIPKGFQFVGPNSLVFEAAQPVTWLATDTERTRFVSCYEGETLTESFVADSNGSPNQVFELRAVPSGKYIAAGSVQVSVNGAAFSESEFITFDQTDQFEIGYNDDPPVLRFGDGVAGNIPNPSSTIKVTYTACSGKAGLVSAHTITSTKSSLVVAFEALALTVDNALGSIGGDDAEDLVHAKTYAPQVYKSRYVAITRNDYEALAGAFADPLFGRVAVAQAVSSRSASSDLELQQDIQTIEDAVDAPMRVSSGSVTLTGTATVATTGVVTGVHTLFNSELDVGSWVKFQFDTTNTIFKVTAITDDFAMAVTPSPAVAIATPGTVTRYGSAVTAARSRLKDASGLLVRVDTSVATIAASATSVDSSIVTATAATRNQRDSAVSAQLDADAADTTATRILTDADYGLNYLATGPTRIGAGQDSSVLYAAKVEGVTVTHKASAVPSQTSVVVSVTGTAITVTLATGGFSTAKEVVDAVTLSPEANALVLASYTGTGTMAAASGVLTFSNLPSGPTPTVTIQGTVYTFVASVTVGSPANQVVLGAAPLDSLLHLVAAINGDPATSGVWYSASTAVNGNVSAAQVAPDRLQVTARTKGVSGNSITTTTAAVGLAWGGATLTGGGAAYAEEAGATLVPPYLPAQTLYELKGFATTAAAQASNAATTAGGIIGGLDTVVTTLNAARQGLEDIGKTTTTGELSNVTDYRNNLQTLLGSAVVLDTYDTVDTTNDVATSLSQMEAAAASNALTINTALTSIYDHVDAILAADCKANLVTVPILARDKSGFYVAPSNGLIRALQEYLDARKEVTQTVQVTSGASALVPANILVRIGVNRNYSESITRTTVEATIDSLLRGRSFGTSLYLSDFDNLKTIPGVTFANVQILGPQTYLDTGAGNTIGQTSNGNLVIPISKVITKGQVSVSTETVTSS